MFFHGSSLPCRHSSALSPQSSVLSLDVGAPFGGCLNHEWLAVSIHAQPQDLSGIDPAGFPRLAFSLDGSKGRAVAGHDQIARPEPGFLGRRAVLDLLHHIRRSARALSKRPSDADPAL